MRARYRVHLQGQSHDNVTIVRTPILYQNILIEIYYNLLLRYMRVVYWDTQLQVCYVILIMFVFSPSGYGYRCTSWFCFPYYDSENLHDFASAAAPKSQIPKPLTEVCRMRVAGGGPPA